MGSLSESHLQACLPPKKRICTRKTEKAWKASSDTSVRPPSSTQPTASAGASSPFVALTSSCSPAAPTTPSLTEVLLKADSEDWEVSSASSSPAPAMASYLKLKCSSTILLKTKDASALAKSTPVCGGMGRSSLLSTGRLNLVANTDLSCPSEVAGSSSPAQCVANDLHFQRDSSPSSLNVVAKNLDAPSKSFNGFKALQIFSKQKSAPSTLRSPPFLISSLRSPPSSSLNGSESSLMARKRKTSASSDSSRRSMTDRGAMDCGKEWTRQQRKLPVGRLAHRLTSEFGSGDSLMDVQRLLPL